MTLLCSVCAYIQGKGDTEADLVKAGYSLCLDHAWVKDELGWAHAVNQGKRDESDDPHGDEHEEST